MEINTLNTFYVPNNSHDLYKHLFIIAPKIFKCKYLSTNKDAPNYLL